MKVIAIRISAIGVLLMGLMLWIYGGAQAGFYKTYYTIDKIDEFTEIEYKEKVDAFLPGIETLAIAFVVFCVLIMASWWLEPKTKTS